MLMFYCVDLALENEKQVEQIMMFQIYLLLRNVSYFDLNRK